MEKRLQFRYCPHFWLVLLFLTILNQSEGVDFTNKPAICLHGENYSRPYRFEVDLPTITIASGASDVCSGTESQISSLTYSATSGSPTTYSIHWETSPPNNFPPVSEAVLPSSPIGITVPANAEAGIYSGTIAVKNAEGYESAATAFTLTVRPLPQITKQPVDQLDCEGNIVGFNVAATGSGLSYIWQRKKPAGSFADISLAGETNVSYPDPGKIRLQNVGSSDSPDGTQYRVIITNSNSCSLTSNPATLTVNEITSVTPAIRKDTICQGNNYSYLVSTSYPSNVVSYQWKKYDSPELWLPVNDGLAISGATTDHLIFTGVSPSESGRYKVKIVFISSGADCNVTSDTRERELTVNPLPSFSVIYH